MTKAILVVSFGTTFPETRQKTIQACEEAIQAAFPDMRVYRAFTSQMVIRRIKNNEGIDIPTVSQALHHLKEQGVRDVYIQPLHLILGGEYEKIIAQMADFKDVFDQLHLAKPLLSCEHDYYQVRDILLSHYGQRESDSATVLMGHGSQHDAFTAYAALDHMLLGTAVHIGCVESYPSVESIEERLSRQRIKTIHLAPFMLVAGDHATHDLASDEKESWYSYFVEKGYEVKTHLIGLGEYPEIQAMYIQHLRTIID